MREPQVFKMPSGASLRVGMAEFASASVLMQAVLKQMAGLKFDPADLLREMDDIRANPQLVSGLLDKAISLATSDDLKSAAFACAKSAAYSPKGNEAYVAVDAALLDDEQYGLQAREDYYTILYRIVEVNCKPFFVRTFSGLLKPRAQDTVARA